MSYGLKLMLTTICTVPIKCGIVVDIAHSNHFIQKFLDFIQVLRFHPNVFRKEQYHQDW